MSGTPGDAAFEPHPGQSVCLIVKVRLERYDDGLRAFLAVFAVRSCSHELCELFHVHLVERGIDAGLGDQAASQRRLGGVDGEQERDGGDRLSPPRKLFHLAETFRRRHGGVIDTVKEWILFAVFETQIRLTTEAGRFALCVSSLYKTSMESAMCWNASKKMARRRLRTSSNASVACLTRSFAASNSTACNREPSL